METIEKTCKLVLQSLNSDPNVDLHGTYYGPQDDFSPVVALKQKLEFQFKGLQDFLVVKDEDGRGFYANKAENLFVWVNGINE